MNTHIAESPTGCLHLTGENGWAHGVTGTVIGAIGGAPVDYDRICKTCLRQEANYGSFARLGRVAHTCVSAGTCISADQWDGAMEVAVGEFIGDYLDANEVPPGSRAAGAFRTWGVRLLEDGRKRQMAQ